MLRKKQKNRMKQEAASLKSSISAGANDRFIIYTKCRNGIRAIFHIVHICEGVVSLNYARWSSFTLILRMLIASGRLTR